nr:unnamed protein product [Digitaria exilis]
MALKDLGGHVTWVARDVGAEAEEPSATRFASAEHAVRELCQPTSHARRANDAGEQAVVPEMGGLVRTAEGYGLMYRPIVDQLVVAKVAFDRHGARAGDFEFAGLPKKHGPERWSAVWVRAQHVVEGRRGSRVEERVALRGMRVSSCALHPYEVARGVDLEEVVLLRVAGADSDDHEAWQA